jgi:acetyl esterase/lipase
MRYMYLLLCIILSGCMKEDDPATDANKEQTIVNLAYGSDPAQKMDVYLPAGRNESSTKVMVLIHGGGWSQGDKADFSAYVDTLKVRLPGYAFFNINYRLANGTVNFFPTQENDVKAAMEFIYGKRALYHIADKFVLLGASAGGHLALLQSYKYSVPVKVRAVIDFFGPVDLVDMYNHPANPLVPALLAGITGGDPVSQPDIYQQSGPINFLSQQSPPTLILQGGVDMLVSPSQSVMLDDKLQMEGVTHEYVFYPTEGHGWTGPNLTDSFIKIVAFLEANVN